MNIVAVADRVNSAIEELNSANDIKEIEEIFSKHNISGIQDKIDILRKCMGVIGVSNAGNEITPEQVYQDEIFIFLDGSWRFFC